ncbi:hypothetical protein [Amycolatopsis australiensis]|uniref:hypothetical protein n=1 Tax=Amycolatopsis australiensis TaxID=546364 RepID=UPI0011612583|nr:hypothetical protein [Amycolatopsis australiensis]
MEILVDRRTFHRSVLLTTLAAPLASVGVAAAESRTEVPRHAVVEFGLPPAVETHEMVKLPGVPLVLVSQMSNSHLVKLGLDPATEEVAAARAFPLGESDAMLHGLALSRCYPGHVWATHEGRNWLLLVDPGTADVNSALRIMRSIPVPDGGCGPHYVGEYDDMLWVGLKGSTQVLAINHTNPASYHLYTASRTPIFVARHPGTGEFYASQDETSQILHINPRTRATDQLPIPAAAGRTPVGLIAGPTGLVGRPARLGTPQQGTGTFGRIDNHGRLTWFHLESPEVSQAGLLHIAFDPPEKTIRPSAWLLGSSIICPLHQM